MNKKKIGTIAAIICGASFLLWMILIFTGACFSGHKISPIAIFTLFTFFISGATATICLAESLIKFVGKSFSAGFNGTNFIPSEEKAFCTHCGKQITKGNKFCPHCGGKCSND
ncbi:MAG: zinc ribbon domain-containing protein [Clostridia bacterium]|nr:zinc ribbon domain-containing protein [Clostridia bacterium]